MSFVEPCWANPTSVGKRALSFFRRDYNTMRLALIFATAALATASLGSAAEPASASTSASASKQAKAKKPRKVCRRETETGSAIPKRICRTIEEPTEQAKSEAAAPAPVAVSREGNAAE
jgi:hypothetical protein